ncbi:MAG TPA: SDR family NAD(P)-dependent oxidoreductase, partial [Thermoanaerobaculia bacterium]|nr:SDR family NAD(P)-dependent oxidoreductase [Thermoanaerobaculia bacterium]
AGLDPATATLVEAHGTSTKVGDVVEVESLAAVFGGAPKSSIALGSAKSNVGHLKAGAGAAGLLKAVWSLHHKLLPPTLNAEKPNPSIDWGRTPFFPCHDLREWKSSNGTPRRCGVSAYGFGGTNFHLVLEEHVPGMLTARKREQVAVPAPPPAAPVAVASAPSAAAKPPLRGVAALGAATPAALLGELDALVARVREGFVPPAAAPGPGVLAAVERLVVDFGTPGELLEKLGKAKKALEAGTSKGIEALASQGIFRGSGPAAGKIAFLFPGQGSQYVNMGRELAAHLPEAAAVFAEADRVMAPILGRTLTSLVFVDAKDDGALKQAEEALKQTAITQPAMLTTDIAVYEALKARGFFPDLVMGHSLGEYGALVAAEVMPFADALEAAAARGREMEHVSLADNGQMAAIMAPVEAVEEVLRTLDGYVVTANINSRAQCVIGGASPAVEAAVRALQKVGHHAIRLPVSHAFHTEIVAPASGPLRKVLDRLRVTPPKRKLVANVTGGLYPETVDGIKEILERQIASPVQWVKGLETLWAEGARTFVEVGPKRALKGFVDDVLAGREGLVSLFTNAPKPGDVAALNHALCGLWAAGHGAPAAASAAVISTTVAPVLAPSPAAAGSSPVEELRTLLTQALRQLAPAARGATDRNEIPAGSIVISGTGLGLPGAEKRVMDPANAERILRGEQFVDLLPERFRKAMRDKRVTRVVKGEDGSGHFQTIESTADVIKLAARPGPFDVAQEYGLPEKLVEALDSTSQLAIAAGLDALREAGIPLVLTWKKTTTGKYLPDRWLLPEALRDETGVVFASAFPGLDRFAGEMERFFADEARRKEKATLEELLGVSEGAAAAEIRRRIGVLDDEIARNPYVFDRRFLFRVLSMGHSQFAEYVGARGPNTQVNSACASTAQAIALAEDWIRSGRCRRVLVLGADNVTGDSLLPWIGAGFLASGAAATDDKVEEAALPFDRRRHGTLIGMGACALVVEAQDTVEERGMRGLAELLSTETRNSAFHGTRLDVDHISQVMESLVSSAERRFGVDRREMARQTVFMSHETFTPARGGSAAAEVVALRHVFGPAASDIVVANTKGFTGHPMGVGIEDVIAVKILEHGIVPPVPNFREVDPDLGPLNLSRGGRYDVTYAIHLAAGFGSQISLTLTRRVPGPLDRVDDKALYRRWLADVSGDDAAELEVVKRNLRVVSTGAPARPPASARWVWGTAPVRRAPAPAAPTGGISAPAPVAPVRETVRAAAPPSPGPAPAPAPLPVEEKAPVAPAPAPPASDDVVTKVLAIVAEKTGYPPEMLELDLDLEADLGVDTVKQAETFAAVRSTWEIPRQENLKLRDFPTLRHVVKFVYDSRPDLAPAPAAEAPAANAASSAPAPAPSLPLEEKVLVAPAQATPGTDEVVTKVLAIVAEKTGYPPEMLELDLDLEADLGVDTVKQAETFAAVRATWDIPREENLKLRDFPTLRHVVQFVLDRKPLLAGAAAPMVKETVASPFEPAPAAAPVPRPEPSRLEDADRVPRRVPVPSLRPPFDLMKPTGVTLGAGIRVVVAPDEGDVAAALSTRLADRGVSVLTLVDGPPAALDAQIRTWLSDGPIQGVYWLTALDIEPPLLTLDLAGFREANRRRTKSLYAAMRVLYESVAPPGTFLVSATRMGGLLGQGAAPAASPLGGAVAGFTKAYKRERPEALVKVVDFEPGESAAAASETLLSETLLDPGIVEAGRKDGLRWTIGLEERPARDGSPGLALGKESVFVVTGSAGGITSAIVADLAAASGGTFWLLDLVSEPRRDDPKIALFRIDREKLKTALIAEAKARGEKPTPVLIDRALLDVERSDAALRAVESVEATGGTAVWRSANLLDGAALSAVVSEIRARHGRIDVLVHAGGVEISRKLSEKEPGEFDLVFDIKADGFFSLLKAAEGMPLGATVVFSSVAGRFGNNGQTDYSAANALLGSISSWLRAHRPETRAIAVDWTAWGGLGMATRGSIPKIMEAAGIDMLSPEAGIPTVRRELVSSGFSGEIVVAGRLGILGAEWDATGGLDTQKANALLAARERPLVTLGTVTAATLTGGLLAETALDPKAQPFLFDHALDGTPLLPGAMGTETFAEAASFLCPGYAVDAVEDEEFVRPFKYFRTQPSTFHLAATAAPAGDSDLLVSATLSSVTQPKKELAPVVRLHFRAKVRMTKRIRTMPQAPLKLPSRKKPLPVGREAIYRVYFHGPAYRVLDGVKVDGDTAWGLLARNLPPNTEPPDAASLVAPRLVELCFQTAGLWEVSVKERLALPAGVASVRVYRGEEDAGDAPLWAVARARDAGESFDVRVVDEQGNVFVELLGYRTVALEGRVAL